MKHKGAGILYTDGKKVLLLRRSKFVGNKYTWDFPGGKIKKNEGHFKAAKRESIEEIGLFKGKKVHKFDDHFLVFMVRVKKPFEVKLNKEHDVAIWVDVDKVKNYFLHPGLIDNWEYYHKTINYIFSSNIAI